MPLASSPRRGMVSAPAGDVADGGTTQIVIHVLAEKATVEADGTKPGYLPGFGAVPADTVRKLANRAKIRQLKQPKDFASESGPTLRSSGRLHALPRSELSIS